MPGPSAARRRWSTAPLVLVGADQTGEVARAGLPHRPEVALIGRDLDDASVWQRGSAVGAAHVLILPDCERWLAGLLAEADSPREEPGAVVAVLSGRGGAGGRRWPPPSPWPACGAACARPWSTWTPPAAASTCCSGWRPSPDRAGRSWRSGATAGCPAARCGTRCRPTPRTPGTAWPRAWAWPATARTGCRSWPGRGSGPGRASRTSRTRGPCGSPPGRRATRAGSPRGPMTPGTTAGRLPIRRRRTPGSRRTDPPAATATARLAPDPGIRCSARHPLTSTRICGPADAASMVTPHQRNPFPGQA